MVVVMEERASEDQIQHVIATLVEKEFDVHRSTGALKTVLGETHHAEERRRRIYGAVGVNDLMIPGDVKVREVGNEVAVPVPVGQVLVKERGRKETIVGVVPVVSQVELVGLQRLQLRITRTTTP